MKKLQVGKVGREPFALPLDVVTQATGVVGLRGKGKTNTVVTIVEEALDRGVQVIVLDPTNVWWGLKSSKDGKKAGYPVVILGGPQGDLPLSADSGIAVADFAVENHVPMILSLRHLKKGAARKFVAEFLEQLYHRKGEPEHQGVMLVVIDEASRFVPQKVYNEKGDYTTRSVGAVEDIVRQGRASGFGIMLIDQRPASVNKDALTQIELLVAHAVTSPQDRKALDEWVEGHDSHGHREEFRKGLAALDTGEAWFWMPSGDLFSRVHVRARRTFDSSKTPKIGEVAATPEKFAKVDLGALGTALEESQRAAIENDPKTLRKENAALKRELQARGEVAPPEGWLSPDAAIALAEKHAHDAVSLAVGALRGDALPHLEGLRHVLANGWKPPRVAPPAPGASVPRRPASTARQVASPALRPRPEVMRHVEGLGGPHRKILNALAWLESIGVSPAPVEAVAFVAGYRPGGGAFNNPKGALRTQSLIDYPSSGALTLTDDGREQAEWPDAPGTLADLHASVMARLTGPEQKILQPLLDAYPEDMDVEELAEAAGYSQGGGAFNNPKGRLRTLGLIDYPRAKRAVAADILFPAGLR